MSAEIWMRPHPQTTLRRLVEFIQKRNITASPRLGVRDKTHFKGYKVGEEARLRVFDIFDREAYAERVEITGLFIRQRISDITIGDLVGCEFCYRNWQDVQKYLGIFAGRVVEPNEPVTIVRFCYLDGSAETEESPWLKGLSIHS